ncbi:hypothetical protein [Spirosoma terrae]|uniref:Outer membrane beta-barrel protein n=1 Tax=Spirosoma terrae TaxID=1968276 RepID=A0A6L9L5I8_9BACT|nr:hypothetical protein [Spirosoma terrae]NDU95875.1 hypothetical protein [Spirosoma terrae]
MSIDVPSPDAVAFRPNLRLTRNFFNNRIVVASTVGYFSKSDANSSFPNFVFRGNQRKRITADFTLLINLLKRNQHTLRIGGGLSVWYIDDKLIDSSVFLTVSPTSPAISLYFLAYNQIRVIDTGWHVTAEYEYLITPKLGIDARLTFTAVHLEQSSLAGIGLGYHF